MSDMTTAHDEAVKAATEAIREVLPVPDRRTVNDAKRAAATAVAAAAPILAAAERQRIAAAIRAKTHAYAYPGGSASWRNSALEAAARIAEETS